MTQTKILDIPKLVSDQALVNFEKKIHMQTLKTSDNVELCYVIAKAKKTKANLIISNGRTESFVLYTEVIMEFVEKGYDVYAVDHRGQGLSERLTGDPHLGHIDQFQQYAADLNFFVESLVPKKKWPTFILSHSMGSAIALDYLMNYPHSIRAMVMIAPMIDIRLPAPKWVILSLAKALLAYYDTPHYVPLGAPYQEENFLDNRITHDEIRYNRYLQAYRDHPQAQLGSPSNEWLRESLEQTDRLFENIVKLATPCLIFQAEDEKIVSNQAQDEFAEASPQVTLKKISGAQHQILLERDDVRSQVILKTIAYFEQHAQ